MAKRGKRRRKDRARTRAGRGKNRCDICTKGTPTDKRPWVRENCPKCKGTGVRPSAISQSLPESTP